MKRQGGISGMQVPLASLALAFWMILSGCADASSERGTPAAGHLWRSTYSTRLKETVSETIDMEGRVRMRGPGAAVPWADGKRFVVTDWDGEHTTLRVLDSRDERVLHDLEFQHLLGDIKPSAEHSLIAGRLSRSVLGPYEWVIYDFEQRRYVHRTPADSAAFIWLPDRSFLTISSKGQVAHGSVGQTSRVVGQLKIPAGREVKNAWMNRQGTTLALRLDLRPSDGAAESDIWLADLSQQDLTSPLQRFTATRIATFAAWSPDGTALAFEVDTGAWCSGFHCTGTCEVWHALATARNVRAKDEARDANRVMKRGSNGLEPMQCSLRGWTL